MYNYPKLLFILAIFLASFIFIPLVQAYEVEPVQIDPSRQDFVVGPGKTDLTLNPGEEKIVEIMVSNRTGLDRDFEIRIEDFIGSQDINSPVVFTSEKGATTLKDFVLVPEKSFFLKNGERARIPVTIKVPEGSEPGGRYASVLISTLVPLDKSVLDDNGRKGGVPLIAQSGTLIFVTIPGEVKKEGQLTEFFTQNHKSIFSYPRDVIFNLVFNNTGAIHLKPYGSLIIRNIFGQEVKNLELTPWFAMPNSLRFREIELIPDSVKGGSFMMGRYIAEAKVFRDYNNLYDTKTLIFWIIPWKILVIVLLVLLALVLVIRSIIRYFSSHFELKSKTLKK